jgi:ubiquinone/menaquinone biosynthesis C-methylase UbiE
MVSVYERFFRLPAWFRGVLYEQFHRLLINRDQDLDMRFLNYGYASMESSEQHLPLGPEDEPNRYSIGMYWHMIAGAPLEGKDVLDVGCGRGGPASFLARRLSPRSCIGLDLSGEAIRFCGQAYTETSALRFVRGDAQDLPFAANSFDAVLNVESCRNYPVVRRFLASVHRVLRPGGALFLADMGTDKGMEALRKEFDASGLQTEQVRDITPNVLHALDMDEERRRLLVEHKAPRPLRGLFSDIAGLNGTERYRKFVSGALKYWSCRLRKPALA